ncbi:MAG: APC family permease [Ilumatobacteraceae bacterium]
MSDVSDERPAFGTQLVTNTGELAKDTNWWGAFVIGLSGTILVIGLVGFAVQALGGFSIPLFVVITAMGVLLCYCLAELAAAMPDRTGGLPSYAFETFRPWGNGAATHIGGLSTWGYWLGWFTVAPINAILAASYIRALFDLPEGRTFDPFGTAFGLPVTSTDFIVGVVILLVMFVPCFLGIRLGARFATVLGIASVIPLLILVFIPFVKPSLVDFGRVDGFGFPEGVTGSFALIIAWVFIYTWSVLAMEAAACYIGECRDPARDAKIAMTAEGLFGFFIYVAVPLMVIAVLGTGAALAGIDAKTVFDQYIITLFGESEFWKWFVGLAIVIALLLSVLNSVMGCARGLYQNAHDGILPRFFGHTNRHGSPGNAMYFNLVCSVILLLSGTPLEIYIFSNMGYLFAAATAFIGYWLFATKRADVVRPVRMPRWMSPVSLVVGVFFLFCWLYGGFYSADYVLGDSSKRYLFWLGLGLLAVYFPLYALRKAEDRRHGTTAVSTKGAPITSA